MKSKLLILILSIFIMSCCSNKYLIKTYKKNKYLDYIPQSPTPTNELYSIKGSEINEYLYNQSSYVTVEKVDADGELTFLDASISGDIGSYKVTMDYSYYKVEPVSDDGTVVIGYKKIGVGIRVIATITTRKANVNLGSLIAIGIAAKENSLSGSLIVDVIGITSNDITNLVPLTADIDQTSIQSVLQAFVAIKSQIHDEDTKLYPQVLALKQIEPGNFDKLNKDSYSKGIKATIKLNTKIKEIIDFIEMEEEYIDKWKNILTDLGIIVSPTSRFESIDDIKKFLERDVALKGENLNKIYNFINEMIKEKNNEQHDS